MDTMRMSCSSPRAVTSLSGVGIQFIMRQMDHHLGRVMALFDKGIENDGIVWGSDNAGGLYWALATG